MMNVETPTHTYLDISVSNNDIAENQNPIPLQFSTRRDADYLINPRDYFVSVARWSIDLRIPLIVPQIPIGAVPQVDGAGNTYWETVYYISIKTPTGGITQQNIWFYPEITNSTQTPPIPVLVNLKQLYDNPYFYISSVSWWLYLVNRALTTAYTNFFLANPNPPVSPVSPYILYNYNGTFNIVANAQFLNAQAGGGNVAGIQMWFNSPLYTLFQFPAQYSYEALNPPFTSASRLNYLMLFNDPSQTVAGGLYYSKTEIPSLQFWSPLSSIVFASQAIPIEPTNMFPTIIFGANSTTDKSGINNNIATANVISDFEVNLVQGWETRTINYYSPAGEYRLIDIMGCRPLSEINIVCYWKDKIQGGFHPVFLHSGGGASLKLLFRKRNYYSEGL